MGPKPHHGDGDDLAVLYEQTIHVGTSAGDVLSSIRLENGLGDSTEQDSSSGSELLHGDVFQSIRVRFSSCSPFWTEIRLKMCQRVGRVNCRTRGKRVED